MERILVEGGIPLMGRIRVKGAKNACLPMMAASLLTSESVILEDVPDLEDVRTMSRLLKALGVEVYHDRKNEKIFLNSRRLTTSTAPFGPVRRMRASFLVMGPLLAREGRSRVSFPGGCAIGTRPIDLHLKGLEVMGAQFTMDEGYIEAETPCLQGATVYLDYPSVGATENILMAAVLAEGTTVIENAAAEPEIVDLTNFLNSLGARIIGAGTPLIRVEGVTSLKGGRYRVIPDRIEAGTLWLPPLLAAGHNPRKRYNRAFNCGDRQAQETGALIEEPRKGMLRVEIRGRPEPVDIKTLPYPGFPTDLQPQFMALLSLA